MNTRTQQLKVVPDKKISVVGGGTEGRGFDGKALYFCWGGVAVFFFFFSIQWAGGFCENVLFSAGGGPSQKCSSLWVSFVHMGSFGMKKMMNKQNLSNR